MVLQEFGGFPVFPEEFLGRSLDALAAAVEKG